VVERGKSVAVYCVRTVSLLFNYVIDETRTSSGHAATAHRAGVRPDAFAERERTQPAQTLNGACGVFDRAGV
jgi:hypothetical protein